MSEDTAPGSIVPESSPSPAPVRVVYNAPSGADQPIEAAGKYWFDRGEYLLPPQVAADLLTRPGFVQIGADHE